MFSVTRWGWISATVICKNTRNNLAAANHSTPTPIGPFVHVDVDVSDLSIELRQNGELRQQARTSQMIYSVAQIVSFASHWMTLAAGDVILTGTPSGVGPIHASDQLEATIDDWPPLRNAVTNARR